MLRALVRNTPWIHSCMASSTTMAFIGTCFCSDFGPSWSCVVSDLVESLFSFGYEPLYFPLVMRRCLFLTSHLADVVTGPISTMLKLAFASEIRYECNVAQDENELSI